MSLLSLAKNLGATYLNDVVLLTIPQKGSCKKLYVAWVKLLAMKYLRRLDHPHFFLMADKTTHIAIIKEMIVFLGKNM